MAVLIAFIAFTVSLVLQPFVIYFLRRHAIIDEPDQRSSHLVPTPRGGGIAVMAGVLAGSLFALNTSLSRAVVISVLLITLTGLAEDIRGLRLGVRLILQLALALPVVLVASRASEVPMALFMPIGVVFMVGAVNAVNFMDGINGISSAVGIGAGGAYGWMLYVSGYPSLALVGLALVMSCIAFIPYNAVSAQVFLGDCGSYGIGAALGGLAVAAWALGVPADAVLAPLAVYVADTSTTIARRWRKGEVWYEPHRSHVYQRLTDHGLSHLTVAVLVLCLVSICGTLGYFITVGRITHVSGVTAMLLTLAVYLSLPTLMGQLMKLKSPANNVRESPPPLSDAALHPKEDDHNESAGNLTAERPKEAP